MIWKAAECRGIQMLWTMIAQVYVETAPRLPSGDPLLIAWLNIANDAAVVVMMDPEPPVP
ncbi:hypothetical protein [Rubripirellula lacrimiformis]|uniref:hypothetical protein n=1 Tax=Rubripirellula lacrimiformis TaxID=1930273 RepID=UPI0011A869B2|nr:hypothetical protein [Rubripirellula lacrimiformis]